ncbi:MAG: TIGR02281 family clan AA aspartic protease [Burkholderiales bacterium]
MITLRHCIAALAVFLFAVAADAADVNVIGLFPGKAVVSINGGGPRTLSVGQKTAEGVTLLSTDRESATLDVGGQRRTLRIGQAYTAAAGASVQTVTLAADTRGHFVVDGQINGGTVRFLVDTGATMIALSSADAARLGIDYRKGQPGMTNTANGMAPAYRVKLDSVRVGDITVNSVDAVVMEGSVLPVALLGMSFLNRMQMRRDGQVMVLTKRF